MNKVTRAAVNDENARRKTRGKGYPGPEQQNAKKKQLQKENQGAQKEPNAEAEPKWRNKAITPLSPPPNPSSRIPTYHQLHHFLHCSCRISPAFRLTPRFCAPPYIAIFFRLQSLKRKKNLEKSISKDSGSRKEQPTNRRYPHASPPIPVPNIPDTWVVLVLLTDRHTTALLTAIIASSNISFVFPSS
jgi:hypothetical protein